MKNMTTGRPMKLIVGFAVPLLIGSIFQQVYNFVDVIVVGRYLGGRGTRRCRKYR